ncbi:hypothetical protein AYO38_00590 [bacterium SCGC AG-212-C10]|nr:hypothetical protein AYO38_00590 [bacterium SCGC AG-212-C10]
MTATIIVGLIAVLPIIAAVLSGAGGAAKPRSAYAAAPAGMYAIGVRSEAETDIIQAIAADGAVVEVARVPHLAGYASHGAVSPDGRFLALVTADAGKAGRATASLLTIDLDSGAQRKLISGLDTLQSPVWSPDSGEIVIRKLSTQDSPVTDVTFVRAALDGSTKEIGGLSAVAGGYAIGFDPDGRFLAVSIDGSGSTLLRDMSPVIPLGNGITRDWRVSPDGTSIAYIDVDVSDGLRYLPKLVRLDGDEKGSVSAQSADGSQALGVAWKPGSASPLYGTERAAVSALSAGGVSAQNASSTGFDVPLDYSPDGSALAVQHWNGTGFDNAGQMEFQLVRETGRQPLGSLTRFYGWARH